MPLPMIAAVAIIVAGVIAYFLLQYTAKRVGLTVPNIKIAGSSLKPWTAKSQKEKKADVRAVGKVTGVDLETLTDIEIED